MVANVSLRPAPSLPLRTHVLGVLIVSGGTLAALPFRRYQPIPDASAAPTQVTGPTQSDIGDTKLHMLADHSGSDEASDAAASDLLVAQLPHWTPAAAPQPRHVTIPLTYEDLAVPVVPAEQSEVSSPNDLSARNGQPGQSGTSDRPGPADQRFNATVTARQQQLRKERSASRFVPRIESLALSNQDDAKPTAAAVEADSLGPFPPSIGSAPEPTMIPRSTKLASVSSHQNVAPLPAAESAQRVRHWIRQPE